jgi:hypothetical protein
MNEITLYYPDQHMPPKLSLSVSVPVLPRQGDGFELGGEMFEVAFVWFVPDERRVCSVHVKLKECG